MNTQRSYRANSPLVLKEGETFAVFDRSGDILPTEGGKQGVFHQDTRFLSRLELLLDQTTLLLLGSSIDGNGRLAADLTNTDFIDGEGNHVPKGSLHVSRSRFLWRGSFFERVRITSFSPHSLQIPLVFAFDADFSDLFEVRGHKRRQRGRRLEPSVGQSEVAFVYHGLDGKIRETYLSFSPQPQEISPSDARFHFELNQGESATLDCTVACSCAGSEPCIDLYTAAAVKAEKSLERHRENRCEIVTSNEQFNRWLTRSLDDLLMLTTQTPYGPYPYAGLPWYSAPFGRDGVITALEMLWIDPQLARGVLAYLAHTQAEEADPLRDAEAGKILHETRKGEMAALGEIPYGRYYGSVDATPLFVSLAGAYFERTRDRAFIASIWPAIRKALAWMDNYGDADGDGFLEYSRRSPQGLVHQGWKDSEEAIFHADGAVAEGPIALCEAQGYAWQARRHAAVLARVLGKAELANEQENRADALREKFLREFWCEELNSYALALDGLKRPCRVRASNAGHALFSGIASPDHAARIAVELLSERFFSGWGIRTVAAGEARYNPISYHNGSIWPHDNALIACGLARYDFTVEAVKIMEGLFQTAIAVDHRLPELFCGFERQPDMAPVSYPDACAPQAWAAGAVFLLLQSCMGLSIDAMKNQISFSHPNLPSFLDEVGIRNLNVGEGSADLLLKRKGGGVEVAVQRHKGEVEVVTGKEPIRWLEKD